MPGQGRKDGAQKGAQRHAEGAHGPRTQQRIVEQNQEPREPTMSEVPVKDPVGRHRIFEGREQHDDADKNSEKNRLDRVNSGQGGEPDTNDGQGAKVR